MVMPATAASTEPACRLGMIPLKGMVLIVTFKPSALAMASIMSMSKPVTLPLTSDSKGGNVVSAPTTIDVLSAAKAAVAHIAERASPAMKGAANAEKRLLLFMRGSPIAVENLF